MQAIILVDPISSGRFLKAYVPQLGYKLIGLFTLSEEALKKGGKYIPYPEKIEYCDAVICSDNIDDIFEQLRKIPYQIAAVIPASEPGVELADQLAHRLQLRGNPLTTSLVRRNKYEARRIIQAQGLSSPDFAACYHQAEALAFARTQTLPVVLKTPKGAGAHHVFICHTLNDVASSFEKIMGEENIFGDAATFVLAESYIVGTQYAIELFGDGQDLHLITIWRLDLHTNSAGISIFDKLSALIDPVELQEHQHLIDYAIAVGKMVGAQWGPCLVEVRDDPVRGPTLIEVGVRLSGIDMPVLTMHSSNFNPFTTTINVYLPQKKFEFEPVQFFKHACLVFCPVAGHGVVEEIDGLEKIKQLPSYVMSHLYIVRGESIAASHDLATIPLYVYLAHQDKAQLEIDIAQTKSAFQIKFVKRGQA